jgi:TPR repeat protein
MGIGCRRDPLQANVWYVKAADQGDERAKHRIAAIRAAADGANPVNAARHGRFRKDKGQGEWSAKIKQLHINRIQLTSMFPLDGEKPKQKRFMIF